MELGMLMIKAIVFGMILTGVLGFAFWRFASKSTETALSRLDRETEAVRQKQIELTDKIKQANEELMKRRAEADALVAKMKEDASDTAQKEREKIVNKARQDAEEIINKAQRTKDDMRKVIEQEMHLKAIDFTVLMMNEIFSDRIKKAVNRDLIEEYLDGLQKVDMSIVDDALTEAEITTVDTIEPDIQKRLEEIIIGKLGRPLQLKLTVDREVLAGIVIRFGSLRLDGSLYNLLKEKGIEMKERLERGLLEAEHGKKDSQAPKIDNSSAGQGASA
jgi:F0F1-type ATP synthase membrane subunit b/b'